jgi:hypothetical protein
MPRGKCDVCGTTKTQFVGSQTSEGDLGSSLNKITGNTELPCVSCVTTHVTPTLQNLQLGVDDIFLVNRMKYLGI